MKTPLRIALLGCGGMGSGHALAISGEDQKKPELLTYDVYSECQIEISPLADKLELAGIYDIDEARMRWVAEKGWHCYGSYEEILNDETVDAVLIATPAQGAGHPGAARGKACALRKACHAQLTGSSGRHDSRKGKGTGVLSPPEPPLGL